jgi:hypothetical protein
MVSLIRADISEPSRSALLQISGLRCWVDDAIELSATHVKVSEDIFEVFVAEFVVIFASQLESLLPGHMAVLNQAAGVSYGTPETEFR